MNNPQIEIRSRPQWLVNLYYKWGSVVYSIADCAQSMIGCGVSPNWLDCVSGALCGGWPILQQCRKTLFSLFDLSKYRLIKTDDPFD